MPLPPAAGQSGSAAPLEPASISIGHGDQIETAAPGPAPLGAATTSMLPRPATVPEAINGASAMPPSALKVANISLVSANAASPPMLVREMTVMASGPGLAGFNTQGLELLGLSRSKRQSSAPTVVVAAVPTPS